MKEEMKNPVSDEKKDEEGKSSDRVYRGGGWRDYPKYGRVSLRYGLTPTYRNFGVGFRIVRNKK